MPTGEPLVEDLRRLAADEGFARSVLAVAGAAALLAFGFGATPEIVATVLVVGAMTALAERKLRTRK